MELNEIYSDMNNGKLDHLKYSKVDFLKYLDNNGFDERDWMHISDIMPLIEYIEVNK